MFSLFMRDDQANSFKRTKILMPVWTAAAFLLAADFLQAAPITKTVPKPAANVVRPAPDVTWIGAGGRTASSKTFRGQPVVILVAPSPDAKAMRKQVSRIEERYLQFSAKKTVFIAAFTQKTDRVTSNIPFAIAANGAAVATAYGVPSNELSVIVISPDGNLDMVSKRVESAQRILDVVNNTFQTQAAARTGIGG